MLGVEVVFSPQTPCVNHFSIGTVKMEAAEAETSGTKVIDGSRTLGLSQLLDGR